MKHALIELESRRVIEKMKRFKNAEQLSNDYILLHPDEWIKTLEGVGQAVADVGRAVTEGGSQDGCPFLLDGHRRIFFVTAQDEPRCR